MQVAQRLSKNLSEIDTIARLGGDEFVVMIITLGKNKAKSREKLLFLAEKIRKALAEPYELMVSIDGISRPIIYHCTASIGVVLFYKDKYSCEELLKLADTAMYQAKEGGRNQIRLAEN